MKYNCDISNHIYKLILNRLIPVMIPMIILSFVLVAKINKDNPVPDKRVPVESIYYDVKLQKNGDAMITETWDLTISEQDVNDADYRNSLKNGIISLSYYDVGYATLTDLSITENGKPLTAAADAKAFKANPRNSYQLTDSTYESEDDTKEHHYYIEFGIGEYGENTYQLSYTLKDMVLKTSDGAALYYRFFSSIRNAEEFVPDHILISISMDGVDLEQVSKHALFTGFRGMNGFHEGCFVAETFTRLRSGGNSSWNWDYVSVSMTFGEGCFEELNYEYDGKYPNKTEYSNKDFSDIYGPDTDVPKRVYSQTIGTIVKVCLPLTFILLTLFIVTVIVHTVRMHLSRNNEHPVLSLDQDNASGEGKYSNDICQWVRYLKYLLIILGVLIPTTAFGMLYFRNAGIVWMFSLILFPSMITLIIMLYIRNILKKTISK